MTITENISHHPKFGVDSKKRFCAAICLKGFNKVFILKGKVADCAYGSYYPDDRLTIFINDMNGVIYKAKLER